MGHEVSHALANHARMSAGQLQQVIGAGVSVATSGQSEQTQQIWNQAMCWVQVGVMLPLVEIMKPRRIK
jgi:Zn-dependent protease with chaperone function